MTIDDLRLALDVGPVREQPAGVGTYAASVARELVALGGVRALIGVRRKAAALDGLDRAGVARAPGSAACTRTCRSTSRTPRTCPTA